jgi:uncharacterized protein
MAESIPTFVADSTLGRLVKNLRLAGFDTLFDRGVPDDRNLIRLAAGRRIILTRSNRVRSAPTGSGMVFIEDDRPSLQMRQVLGELRLNPDDLRPFSRCALCNQALVPLSRQEALPHVPDYVRQQHTTFQQCPDCRRVYWQGSHTERWKKHMQAWFEPV